MPADGKFTITWLRQLIKKIDELWYEGKLLSTIRHEYGKDLVLSLDVGDDSVAGYVKPDAGELRLHMNLDLFHKLFHEKASASYHAGGLVCTTRFNCFLHIVLHESVHIFLALCEKMGQHRDINDHGRDFYRAIRQWFGQQEHRHGLIDGFNPTQDIATIKAKAQVGEVVEMFLDGSWVPGRVVTRGRKYVHVRECDKDGTVHRVHFGILRVK